MVTKDRELFLNISQNVAFSNSDVALSNSDVALSGITDFMNVSRDWTFDLGTLFVVRPFQIYISH